MSLPAPPPFPVPYTLIFVNYKCSKAYNISDDFTESYVHLIYL